MKTKQALRPKTTTRHFLDIADFDARTVRHLLEHAAALKEAREEGKFHPLLAHKKLAMIFEKSSTRTRVSFEVAMSELGGQALMLNGADMQTGRGESAADTARVLSRYVDAIMLRCHDHEHLLELARHASVPVVNGLTCYSHPCQILADILTFEESVGPIAGKTVAWIGDGNNVAHSWIQAAAVLGFTLRLACPKSLAPDAKLLAWAKGKKARIELMANPADAVAGADAVVTDAWVSMGDNKADAKRRLLKPYQVHEALMKKAAAGAIFLHCLPAHRGEEVTAGVIDGPQSRVFDEAENRLHVQKAVLLWCLGKI